MIEQSQWAALMDQPSESDGTLRKLAMVARNTDNAVIITDAAGCIEWVNAAFTRISGYRLEEVLGLRPGQVLQGRRTDPATVAMMSQRLRHGLGFKTEIVNYAKNGREYLLELDVQPALDARGRVENYIAVERDVSESSELLNLALESARQGVWHCEAGRDQISLSGHFLQLFGYDDLASSWIDRHLLAITHRDDRAALAEWYQDLRDGRQDQGEIEYRIVTAEGDWRWILSRGKTVAASVGKTARRIIGIHTDITEHKLAESEIRRMAYFDALTGLANRTMLIDRMEQAASLARRQRTQVGVLFLDLDNFKSVNDLVGHIGGDRILVSVSERVGAAVRAESVLARMGGDEFVLLLTDLPRAEDAAIAARRILEVLAEPFVLDEQTLHITASIGIAMYPADGEDSVTLIKNADTAMHAAKDAGRNGVRFFTTTMSESVMSTLRIESRLRSALKTQALHLAYQPKVDARSRQIVGMEALVRWRDPELGLIPPSDFIPVAERHGMIAAIGDWVLRAACAQNQQWQAAGLPAVPVAVNISALDFDDPGFPARIQRALQDSGLAPRFLELELTEGALMKDPDGAVATLKQIKALGVSLAIDDFGTGYSSLAYLGTFPIDRLKIDQSFVRDLPNVSSSAEITRAIIGIAKRLNMKVVAEGVETDEHARFLEDEQCDDLQGYLFSRPVSASEFEHLLLNGLGSPA
jgi:diguanylate cyclase (GGDEF)-like protein/PAS domain S-box-containing protein